MTKHEKIAEYEAEILAEDKLDANLPEGIARLVDEILFAMSELPEGTELTAATAIELTRAYQGESRQGDELYSLYEGLALSQRDLWDFKDALIDRAEGHGLFLDGSEWDGMLAGTPETIPFRVRRL